MSTGYIGGRQVVDFRPSVDPAMRQAACAEEGVAPMFPHEQDTEGIDYAKSICARCPVQPTCLAEALDRHEGFGIWGGMTTDERRQLRKTQRKADAKASKQTGAAKALKQLAENGTTPIIKRPTIG